MTFGYTSALYRLDISHCLSQLIQHSQFSTSALNLFFLCIFLSSVVLEGRREKCMHLKATLNMKLSTDFDIWISDCGLQFNNAIL